MRSLLGSVRVRTTLAATLLTAVVLIGGSVAIVRVVERDLVETAGKGLRQALEDAGLPTDGAGRRRVLQVGTADGEMLLAFTQFEEHPARIEGLLLDAGEAEPFANITIDAESNDVLALTDLAGRSLMAQLAPIDLRGIDFGEEGDDDEESLVSRAALEEVREGVDAVANALLLIVPALIVILGLSTWFVVGRALRPVHAISAQVAGISTTTLDERVPVPDADDEIAELARLMNQMLDRLEAGSERQRRFVADASHELRSPLSTIAAAAEVAQASEDPTRFGQLADEVAAESARMEALIADMLDLARLDEQRGTPGTERVGMGSLAERVVARTPAQAIDVDVAATGDPMVEGSSAQLERAVSNVLLNAVAHAATAVRLEVAEDGSRVLVRVDDDGPGIEPADRERIFERFVRLDASRQRQRGGAGIGLSLVRAIVERHGGEVSVSEAPELHGARFVVDLPRAEPQSAP